MPLLRVFWHQNKKNKNVAIIMQFPYFSNSPDLLWNHPDVLWVNIFVPFNYIELFSEIKRSCLLNSPVLPPLLTAGNFKLK